MTQVWPRRAVSALLLCFGAVSPDARSIAATGVKPAYFISIDGLQSDLLFDLHAAAQLPAPRGLGWLLDHSLVVERAWPVVTTMTAPSHISTITCTPPSRHGVIANQFLRGRETVNGFDVPFATEPLWRSAMRQGRKVLSLGYVGSGGGSVQRSATFGLTYPDPTQMAPPQTLHWDLATLPLAKGWQLPRGQVLDAQQRETQLTLTLNPQTKERRILDVLISADGQRIEVAAGKDLAHSFGTLSAGGDRPLDILVAEANGRKRRVTIDLTTQAPGTLQLQVSRPSYNHAYPDSFRLSLDAADLIWPDPLKSTTSPANLADYVRKQAVLDDFLTTVAERFVGPLGADLVLFYQPLIDSLGHEAQAALPRPFKPGGDDPVTKAFADAFARIDRNISVLLAGADAQTSVALMGDHGMDATYKSVNAAALLPGPMRANVKFVTSSGLLLLYAVPGQQAAAEAVGTDLYRKLKALRGDDGRLVLASGLSRRGFSTKYESDYTREWPYGDALWAFMGQSGYAATYQPQQAALFLPPTNAGMHGTSLQVASMATALLIHGPKAPVKRLADTSLLNAVPTFVKMLGLRPPHDCIGQPLF